MKALVIDIETIRHNARAVREKAGQAHVYAALPADAFGAGLEDMAKFLRGEGFGRFAVTEPADAAVLRKAGLVDEEILMLRSTTEREDLEKLIDLNVVCTIGSYDAGVALNGLAEARSTVAEAHLLVDTGGSYGGFLAGEPDKILSMYRYLPNVALSGLYTQLPAGGREASDRLEVFAQVAQAVRSAGFETGTVHVGGPGVLAAEGPFSAEAIHVGEAFLGRGRRSKGDGLRKAGFGETPLGEIRWLPRGHSVGYGKPFVIRKPVRAAVLPVGRLNGFGVYRSEGGFWELLRLWRRGLSPTVRVGEQRAKVIGSIGPLETLVDVTDIKCAAGDKAVFEVDPLYARGLERIYR